MVVVIAIMIVIMVMALVMTLFPPHLALVRLMHFTQREARLGQRPRRAPAQFAVCQSLRHPVKDFPLLGE